MITNKYKLDINLKQITDYIKGNHIHKYNMASLRECSIKKIVYLELNQCNKPIFNKLQIIIMRYETKS